MTAPRPSNPTTCWNLIRSASEGAPAARAQFADRYLPAARAYLRVRWNGTALEAETEDAVQEVFMACFRTRGALEDVEFVEGGSFRAYFFGVIRNVALRFERSRGRLRTRGESACVLETVASREQSCATEFDRAWARTLMREAAEVHRGSARAKGEDASRRAEILRLRFEEELPIREIARRWSVDAARLHHDYAQARAEFVEALREVVKEHLGDSVQDLEGECTRLFELLR